MTTPVPPYNLSTPDGAVTVGGGSWNYGQTITEATHRAGFELEAPTPDNMLDLLRIALEQLPRDAMGPWAVFLDAAEGFLDAADFAGQVIDSLIVRPVLQTVEAFTLWVTNFFESFAPGIGDSINGFVEWFNANISSPLATWIANVQTFFAQLLGTPEEVLGNIGNVIADGVKTVSDFFSGLWDAFTGNTGSSGISIDSATLAAAALNTRTNTAQAGADAASAGGQQTIDYLYDAFNGTTGASGVSRTSMRSRGAAVRASAVTGEVNASTALSNAATAQGQANTATANAAAAQTTADDAKTVGNALVSQGQNLIADPSFENGFYLSGPGAEKSSAMARTGNTSVRLTGNGAYPYCYVSTSLVGVAYLPANAGETYRFEVWYRGDAENTQASVAGIRIGFTWFDTSKANLGSPVQTFNCGTAYLSSWTKATCEFTAPAGTAYVMPYVQLAPSVAVGEKWYFDDAVMREETLAIAAQQDADVAQADAATGIANAATAQGAAVAAQNSAATAQSTAVAAQGSADDAADDAAAAAAAAALADGKAVTAQSAASNAQSTADTANTSAGTANTNLQTTVDYLYDAFNGTTGATGTSRTSMRSRGAAVRASAVTGETNAATALTNAATADAKAVTAQGTADTAQSAAATADAKAVTAQSAAATADAKAVTADGKAVSAQSAAAAADSKAVAAQVDADIAEQEAILAKNQAKNLTGNLGFENTGWYISPHCEYSTEVVRTGQYSCKATSPGSAFWVWLGTDRTGVRRYPAAPGDVWYIEASVYGHPDNLNGATMYLYAQGHNAAGQNVENLHAGSINAGTPINGGWHTWSGYRVLSHPDIRTLAVGIYCVTPAGNVYYFDDPVVRIVTDGYYAQQDADAAQATANTGVANAATAQTAANTAQSTANTASTAASNAQSTANTANAAAGTANTNLQTTWNDLFDAFNGSSGSTGKTSANARERGAAVRNSAVTGEANASTALTNAATADGKAVAAQGTADTAVTNAATADGKAVAAQALLDASTNAGANMIPDPGFENSDFDQMRLQLGYTGWFTHTTQESHSGSRSVKLTMLGQSYPSLNLTPSLKPASTGNRLRWIPTTVGRTYYVSQWVYLKSPNAGTRLTGLYLMTYNEDFSAAGYVVVHANPPLDTWTQMSGYLTINDADAAYMVPLFGALRPGNDTGAVMYLDDVVLIDVTDAYNAQLDADAAQADANTGIANAAIAKTQADLGVTNAATADSKAVVAQSVAGSVLGRGANIFANGSFENTDIFIGTAANRMLSTEYARTGVRSLKMIGYTFVYLFTDNSVYRYSPCSPGDKIYVEGYILGHPNNVDTLARTYMQVCWYRSDGSQSGCTNATGWNSYGVAHREVWTKMSGTVTAPADAVGFQLVPVTNSANAGAPQTNIYYFDDIAVYRITEGYDAQVDADLGIANAATAQSTANTGVSNAAAAQADINNSAISSNLIPDPTFLDPNIQRYGFSYVIPTYTTEESYVGGRCLTWTSAGSTWQGPYFSALQSSKQRFRCSPGDTFNIKLKIKHKSTNNMSAGYVRIFIRFWQSANGGTYTDRVAGTYQRNNSNFGGTGWLDMNCWGVCPEDRSAVEIFIINDPSTPNGNVYYIDAVRMEQTGPAQEITDTVTQAIAGGSTTGYSLATLKSNVSATKVQADLGVTNAGTAQSTTESVKLALYGSATAAPASAIQTTAVPALPQTKVTGLPPGEEAGNEALRATIFRLSDELAALKAESEGAETSGQKIKVNFSEYGNQTNLATQTALPDKTWTVTSTGPTWGVVDGVAKFTGNVSGTGTAKIIYQGDPADSASAKTFTDAQKLRGVIGQIPDGYNQSSGGPEFTALGRVSDDGNSYVWATARFVSPLNLRGSIGCRVGGTTYTWATDIPLGFATEMTFILGTDQNNLRKYQVYSGTDLVWTHTETGSSSYNAAAKTSTSAVQSSLGSGFRKFGGIFGYQNGMTGGGISSLTLSDNLPVEYKGSVARMHRTATADTGTMSTSDNALPTNFFAAPLFASQDITANSTDGTFKVSNGKMYLVNARIQLATHTAANCRIDLQVSTDNGASWATTQLGATTWAFDSFHNAQAQDYAVTGHWLQYLNAGDMVRLVTRANTGSKANFLTGGPAGTTYFTISAVS